MHSTRRWFEACFARTATGQEVGNGLPGERRQQQWVKASVARKLTSQMRRRDFPWLPARLARHGFGHAHDGRARAESSTAGVYNEKRHREKAVQPISDLSETSST